MNVRLRYSYIFVLAFLAILPSRMARTPSSKSFCNSETISSPISANFFASPIDFFCGIGYTVSRNRFVTQRDVGAFVPSGIRAVSFFHLFSYSASIADGDRRLSHRLRIFCAFKMLYSKKFVFQVDFFNQPWYTYIRDR